MSADQTEIRVTRKTRRRIKPRRNQPTPKQQLAYELAQRNWSLADIGLELGVTRERARQLVVRYEELRMAGESTCGIFGPTESANEHQSLKSM
jgi:hypothetical protein